MIFQRFMETTVGALNLSVPFARWAVICDSDDVVKMHAASGLKLLFCSVSKDGKEVGERVRCAGTRQHGMGLRDSGLTG